MKTLKYIYITLFSLTILSSCEKYVPYEPAQKEVFLFYSASANDLENFIWKNVQSIQANYVPNKEKDIYIFFKKKNGKATLSRLVGVKGNAELRTVKEYDELVSCAAVGTLDLVMNDISSLKNVTRVTDILLSSHGSSWTPTIFVGGKLSGETYEPSSKSRAATGYSFGQEGDETINVDEIADILEKYNLNSIIFDACNMCSIEVVYELRNCAKYILSSPAEILADGLNYPAITSYFTKEITMESLRIMAEETYKLYLKQSAIMTVTDCSKLDALAIVIKEITASYATEERNRLATPKNMIRYDFKNGVAKDYLQYLNNLLDLADAPHNKAPLQEAWGKTFPYVYTTEALFGFPMNGACGVGGYIYREEDIDARFNPYYKTLEWGKLILE